MAISENNFLSVCRQLAEAIKSSRTANEKLDAVINACDFDSPNAPQDVVPYIQWLQKQLAEANAAREMAEAKCAEMTRLHELTLIECSEDALSSTELEEMQTLLKSVTSNNPGQALLDKLARVEALIETYHGLKEQAREFGNHDLAETYRTIQEELEQALEGEPHA